MITISIGSGMMVAGGSLMAAYNGSFDKYNIEDGYFEVQSPLSAEQTDAIESKGNLTLYRNYFLDESLKGGKTLRIFVNRKEVDLACVMEGRLPKSKNETAIDRMFASNNHISIGDTLRGENGDLTVVGFVALSDYSSLFKNNTDSMFDALNFGTAVVTESTWENHYEDKAVHYRYSWLYDKAPKTDAKAASGGQNLCSLIYKEAPSLSEFTPQYKNQAIRFTGEDFESDTMGTQVFIYILILILAFLVGIMTSDNLEQESGEIGTLRSLGYTKKELILHYSAIPMRVILAAALVGNALGYTVLKNICVHLYYNSYSLPTYHTVWNAKALLLTTIIPLILMFLVCTLLLSRKLRHPIQDFLRGEIGEKSQKRAMRLRHGIPLPIRFSIRIIRQNRAGFILLFIGIFLADFLAIFGMMFPKALDQYETDVQKEMIAKHVTLLKALPSVQAGNITSTLDFIKNVQTKTIEITRLYLLPIFLAVILSEIAAIPKTPLCLPPGPSALPKQDSTGGKARAYPVSSSLDNLRKN